MESIVFGFKECIRYTNKEYLDDLRRSGVDIVVEDDRIPENISTHTIDINYLTTNNNSIIN